MPNKGRHCAPWCEVCGYRAQYEDELTGSSYCILCAEMLLRDNLYGLQDPESVAYKRWRLAYQLKRAGRPKITTPTAAQINQVIILPADYRR